MINNSIIHLNKFINYLSIPSLDCCLKPSPSESINLNHHQTECLINNNDLTKTIEIKDCNVINENAHLISNDEPPQIDIIKCESDKIEDKEVIVDNETNVVSAHDDDNDININNLLPTFINNLKKQQAEIELAEKLNIDDKIDDDPLKIYSNEIMMKKLKKIDSGAKITKNSKKTAHRLGMKDELSLADYLHERLFIDMMSKSSKKSSKQQTDNTKSGNKSNFNFYGDNDDDIYDKFESTLLYRYGLASRFFEKDKKKTLKKSKRG